MDVEPEAIVALAILALVVVSLVREVASPAAVMVGGLVLFVLTGILPAERAFLGLANPATISIAGLFVVARAVRDHGGIDDVVARVLGSGVDGTRRALVRLAPSLVGMSAIANNTPLVATAGPIVRDWAVRRGVAATHLLIPVSFLAILGGTLTLIGTGPNLVVSGLLEAAGHEPFGFFTITAVGAPLAAVGAGIVVALAPRVLPDRRSPHERLAGHERDYTVRMTVGGDGSVAGRSVADAGLRDLASTYLASIERDGHEIGPAAPETVLEDGDELVFVGQVDEVRDLLEHPGLVESEASQTRYLDGRERRLFECVVASTSPLVGSTLKALSFRGRYGGAVLALHRAGERVDRKLGEVVLHAGDAMLVLADHAFADRWRGHGDFAVVVPLEADGDEAPSRYRALTLVTVGGMVVLAASGLVTVVFAILLACSLLVASRAIPFGRALDALDRDVLLIVAAAIGLGAAIEASGLAGVVASAVVRVAGVGGAFVALAAVVLGTLLLTELITNVAAAALMVPVALDTAMRVGVEPRGFAVAVAVAASASFLTPIGYQTNTIVYGLGGYRFGDYWRLGLPLVATALASCLVVVPLVWG